MARMQASGYDKNLRLEILKSAMKAYRRKVDDDKKGEQPLYRRREWKKKERRKEKEIKRKNWYKKGGKESIMFISATPNSELRNLLQEEINKTSFKIKVIEKSGTKLIRHLQKNDPFKTKICRNKRECMVCSGSNPGACRDTGVSYRINCLANESEEGMECKFQYTRETGKNRHTRGKKHYVGLQK